MGKKDAKKHKRSKRKRDRVSHKKRECERSSSILSSSSTESESANLKKQLKLLKKEVNEIRNKPSTSVATFQLSDEQTIPIFDSTKNDITISKCGWLKLIL